MFWPSWSQQKSKAINVNMTKRTEQQEKEVFFSKTKPLDNGCYMWTGSKNKKGYGYFSCLGERFAHRASYAIHKGQIPPEYMVRHSCDNPWCVNPQHLSIGKSIDNVMDMVSKGRSANQRKTHCPHGHEYTCGNTRITNKNQRRCIVCIKIRKKRAKSH